MYISFEDIRELIINSTEIAENPGIFVEHMGECYEITDVVIDDDGDIIIVI